jgi:hypothetical protein
MGITKKIDFENIFIFLFLIIFPFGQIIRLSFNFAGINIPAQPLDLVVGLGAAYSVFFQKNRPKIFEYIRFFLSVAVFSFAVSFVTFGSEVVYGAFYLLRLTSYLLFLNYVWNFAKKSISNKRLLMDSLLAISIISALFGWLQFFIIPDIKPFFVYDWDMHLFRLVGTFLDPTFLGIIIVFGLILSIYRYMGEGKKRYLFITALLLISLAFTYSRASYLAFLGGVSIMVLLKKKYRKILFWIVGLLAIMLLLPTARNRSIELTRTFSITSRLTNYRETFELFKRFPIFGIGYNNMCIARNKYVGVESYASHACSGSDSSLLFILATTGIIGLMIFFGSVFGVFKLLGNSNEQYLLMAISSALFVHSLFSNSLFFPWVMGYLVLLLGASFKE